MGIAEFLKQREAKAVKDLKTPTDGNFEAGAPLGSSFTPTPNNPNGGIVKKIHIRSEGERAAAKAVADARKVALKAIADAKKAAIAAREAEIRDRNAKAKAKAIRERNAERE